MAFMGQARLVHKEKKDGMRFDPKAVEIPDLVRRAHAETKDMKQFVSTPYLAQLRAQLKEGWWAVWPRSYGGRLFEEGGDPGRAWPVADERVDGAAIHTRERESGRTVWLPAVYIPAPAVQTTAVKQSTSAGKRDTLYFIAYACTPLTATPSIR